MLQWSLPHILKRLILIVCRRMHYISCPSHPSLIQLITYFQRIYEDFANIFEKRSAHINYLCINNMIAPLALRKVPLLYLDPSMASSSLAQSLHYIHTCWTTNSFCKKETGSLHLVWITMGSTQYLIKNQYPLALIHELLDLLQVGWFFSKIELWDTDKLVRIRPNDNGRQHSTLNMGISNTCWCLWG